LAVVANERCARLACACRKITGLNAVANVIVAAEGVGGRFSSTACETAGVHGPVTAGLAAVQGMLACARSRVAGVHGAGIGRDLFAVLGQSGFADAAVAGVVFGTEVAVLAGVGVVGVLAVQCGIADVVGADVGVVTKAVVGGVVAGVGALVTGIYGTAHTIAAVHGCSGLAVEHGVAGLCTVAEEAVVAECIA